MATLSDTIDHLRRFKQIVGRSPEAAWVARGIEHSVPNPKIHWLEIGCADGRNLSEVTRGLSATKQLTGSAYDPALDRDRLIEQPGFTYFAERIEDAALTGSFDVIHARHSLYYVAEVANVLRNLRSRLNPGGAFIITHWSADCVLSRLNKMIALAQGIPAAPSMSDLTKVVCARGLSVAATLEHRSPLPATVLSDPQSLETIFEMSARNSPVPFSVAQQRDELEKLIMSPKRLYRASKTVFIQRRPTPEQL
ncbi:MAG: class I SAM-dependent methyltransferase [Alphaproteobacteria bacterium]|nr:MAG: class I SAM-dependent methyltransferase [Alphaproteobacteria bacterium]